MTEKWTRSSNGILFGVCQGISDSWGVPVGLVRILWVISVLMLGWGVALYILLTLVLPLREEVSETYNPKILGVCYLISKKTGHEVALVRLTAIILGLSSLGIMLLIYFGLYIYWLDEIN